MGVRGSLGASSGGDTPGWQGRAGQPGTVPPLQPGASCTSMGKGLGQGQAGPMAHWWAWLGGDHGWAGQGRGELETSPAGAATGGPGG